MENEVPKYHDPAQNIIYEADSCTPLREAWIREDLELTSLGRGTYPGKVLLKDELPGIRSIGYWNIKKLQQWGLEWHTNEGIEICFLESGSLDFQIKGSKFKLQANDITITRPWIVHKIGTPFVSLSKLYWLILDVNVRHPHQKWEWPDWIVLNQKDIEDLTRYLRHNEQPVWKANPEFAKCWAKIGSIIKDEQTKSYESRLKVQINQILISLLEIISAETITLDHSLTESKRSIELFIHSLHSRLDEEWSVEKMAECCQIGITRFTHYCKEITNCSPMEYLKRLRLRKASDVLIQEKTTPIIDVAFMSGFSSSQYFNFAFKKHFKTTPKQYRNRHFA